MEYEACMGVFTEMRQTDALIDWICAEGAPKNDSYGKMLIHDGLFCVYRCWDDPPWVGPFGEAIVKALRFTPVVKEFSTGPRTPPLAVVPLP